MGTRARIVLYAPSEATAAAAAQQAFDRIETLNAVLSDYRTDSELSELSAHPVGSWIPVSNDLMLVLQRAQAVSEASDGAFDITVAPAVTLWREARRTGTLPDQEAIANAARAIGWRSLELDPQGRRARFNKQGMQLDPGGIGKGHAALEALRVLRTLGHDSAMVDLGGDLALGAPPPGTRGWSILTRDALGPDRTRMLAQTCIATSGDAEQFALIAGRRYSHILDPRTARALTARRAATVIHPDGAIADALASAACVLGPDGVRPLRLAFPDAEIGVIEAPELY